jgi:hypothetical protein
LKYLVAEAKKLNNVSQLKGGYGKHEQKEIGYLIKAKSNEIKDKN